MGESIVDFAKDAEKVRETAASNFSNPSLEVSVSFGRFENDSLSWEKWSTFSPNKYLEEVEKCATPGSVAQKRAYFEAHYKRIAAKKAEELLEQEKQMQDGPFRSDEQNGGDQINCGTHSETYSVNSQSNAQGHNEEDNLENEISSYHEDDFNDDDVITIEVQNSMTEKEKEETDSRLDSSNLSEVSVKEAECQSSLTEGEIEETNSRTAGSNLKKLEELEELVSVKEVECQISLTEAEKGETDSRSTNPNLNKPDELVSVKGVENVPASTQELQGIPKKADTDIGKASEVKERKMRLPLQKGAEKVTPVSKERNMANSKKKPVAPLTKTPQKSTPRVSKPASTSTLGVSKPASTSTPRVSKPISTSTPRMSKSISTSTPRVSKSTSTSTPRVSKSISTSTASPASGSSVKKVNSSSLDRSRNPSIQECKKVPPKALHMSLNLDTSKPDSPSVGIARKSLIMEKMGDKDIVKRAFKTFQHNFNQPKSASEEHSSTPKQLSTKGKESRVSPSAPLAKENGGSLKMDARDKISAKTAPLSFGLRSGERAEKTTEFSRKSEPKLNSKETERTHVEPNSKDQKDTEIKKLRQSHNFKATPTLGQKMSKSTSEKVSSTTETDRRPNLLG